MVAGVKTLVITGTIPIVYKRATYHVLLTIWVPFSYPDEAPSVSVVPTDDLAVPVDHSFVSPQGHVDYKKLGFVWDSSYHSTFLVETLQQAFGNEPPLRRHAIPPTYPNSALATQVPPSYKPNTFPTASPTTGSSTAHFSSSRPNGASGSSSPVPMTGTSHMSPSSSSSAVQEASKALEKDKFDDQLLITASQLASAYEAMAEETNSQYSQIQNSLEEWQQHKDFYAKKLETSLSQQAQLNALETNQRTEIQQLEASIAQKAAQLQGDIDYDSYAEPSDPTLRIALPFHAKDLAIDDAQYHLEKALQNNTIDLKQFLKATRDLANDQYYQRAMLRKLNVQIPVHNDL